mmetsp:Transcript_112790/g.224352  ORF Transcript_112790/g.224352 Transcript_112790/m.224352 type:complete len:389 (-) Transcript_112790:11-1177(-)
MVIECLPQRQQRRHHQARYKRCGVFLATGAMTTQILIPWQPCGKASISLPSFVLCHPGRLPLARASFRCRVAEPALAAVATASTNNSPDWLPGNEELKALAAEQKPVTFFCLRREGARGKAICSCEVDTCQADSRSFCFSTSAADEHPVTMQVTVQELPFSEGKLGGHVWDASILMAAWAVAPSSPEGNSGGAELFANKRVLELGSGMGLLGLALVRSTAKSVVFTDFGPVETDVPLVSQQQTNDRLIPAGLLRQLRANVHASGALNVEVRRLDWHDFLKNADRPAVFSPQEQFERIVAADVVYYASDLQALAAAIAAHLLPGGRAFIFVPCREWTGHLASERATAEDLIQALAAFGDVHSTAFVGHCGTIEGSPIQLVELQRWSAEQ